MSGRQKHRSCILFLPYFHFTPDQLGDFLYHCKSGQQRVATSPPSRIHGEDFPAACSICPRFVVSFLSWARLLLTQQVPTALGNDPRGSAVGSHISDGGFFLCLQPPTDPSWLIFSELHKMSLEELRGKSGQSSSKMIRFISFTTIWCLCITIPSSD